jgi:hypothetical protein
MNFLDRMGDFSGIFAANALVENPLQKTPA